VALEPIRTFSFKYSKTGPKLLSTSSSDNAPLGFFLSFNGLVKARTTADDNVALMNSHSLSTISRTISPAVLLKARLPVDK